MNPQLNAAIKIGLLLAMAYALDGCAQITARVNDDMTSFGNLSAKYGTQYDQQCYAAIQAAWAQYQAMATDQPKAGNFISDAYFGILMKRFSDSIQPKLRDACGALSVELIAWFGQTAARYRP